MFRAWALCHSLWRRANAQNISYCLFHCVYYLHQHSVDTPVCLPPCRCSYLVLLRTGITLSKSQSAPHFILSSVRHFPKCVPPNVEVSLYWKQGTHHKPTEPSMSTEVDPLRWDPYDMLRLDKLDLRNTKQHCLHSVDFLCRYTIITGGLGFISE